jgi:hypothetical protein
MRVCSYCIHVRGIAPFAAATMRGDRCTTCNHTTDSAAAAVKRFRRV